jgi:hypothetical protein
VRVITNGVNPPVSLDTLALLYADQPVLHAGRRATFLRMDGGEAIIRYWGGSHAVAVPPETLSLRPRFAGARRSVLPASDEPTTRESAENGPLGL